MLEEVAPEAAENLAGPQALQAFEEAALMVSTYLPREQAVQALDAVDAEKVPGMQSLQVFEEIAPVVIENVPAEHPVQTVASEATV